VLALAMRDTKALPERKAFILARVLPHANTFVMQ
jgi:hypothetical protein